MSRLHLIEILEQPRCPKVVQDTATDYLQFSASVGNHYGVIGQRLRQALQKMNCQTVIDLGSGGGGPWSGLFRKIEGVDGSISCLRSYSESELQSMIASAGGKGISGRSVKTGYFIFFP